MTRFILLASASFLVVACTETVVKKIPAEGGTPTPEPDAGTTVVVDPTDAGADAGILGRRLGDLGCQGPDDCDSNKCFKGATESFCTKSCDLATAKEDCPPPLAGTCSRQFLCDRAE